MKYTLIQTYPGYETLGIIHCSENKTPEWRGTNFYDAHPKFWQKVEEVDYQILSFQDVNNDSVITYRNSKNVFIIESANDNQYEGCSLEEELENVDKGYYKILSVKRLSDGEVFTIGDEISTGHFTKNAKIDRIAITNINYQLQGIWVSYKGGSCALSGITKVKKTPLFTTEDGKEIFEGDKFSIVQSSTFQRIDECKYPLTHPNNWLCFSTKEKAEEFVILNKPCLSLNDLISVWGNAESPETAPLFLKFKKIAKSKL